MTVILFSFELRSVNSRLLAAYLKERGHKVFIIFCLGAVSKKMASAALEFVKASDVGLIGISLVTDDFEKAKLLTDVIKQDVKVPIIWGGAHPSIRPDECLKYADMVCQGEGEEALAELCESIDKKQNRLDIKNIVFKKDGQTIRNDIRCLTEDLDALPFEDVEIKDHLVLTEEGIKPFGEDFLRGQYSIMCSRGCPFSCSYCYNNERRRKYSNKGKYLRERSIESVLEELVKVKRRFPSLKLVNFWDDNFFSRDEKQLAAFAEGYRRLINLPFFCLANPSNVSEEKIKLLKSAGLFKMQIGVQTGSERVNFKVYHRPILNKNVIQLAFLLKKYKITPVYDIIFNNPYEAKEDLKETIKLLARFPKPFVLQGFNLIFYPGSDITDQAIKDSYIQTTSRIDELAKIQSSENTPLGETGEVLVSERFYKVLYSVKEKEYLNSLIVLIQHYPAFLIILLSFQENFLTRRCVFFLFWFRRTAARMKFWLRQIVNRAKNSVRAKV